MPFSRSNDNGVCPWLGAGFRALIAELHRSIDAGFTICVLIDVVCSNQSRTDKTEYIQSVRGPSASRLPITSVGNSASLGLETGSREVEDSDDVPMPGE